MALTGRYLPTSDPAEQVTYALDFSHLLPPGVTISAGTLAITNATTGAAAPEWVIGTVTTQGRRLYASLTGGRAGTDYALAWQATDSSGSVWRRTIRLLSAATS